MQVLHTVSKKIEANKVRLFFRVYNDSDADIQGEIVIELQRFITFLNVYNVIITLEKKIMPGTFAFVYFDVPKVVLSKFRRYDWALVDGEKKYIGKGKNNDKIEHLV